jgi:methylmalonyl-CoA mutase cobalamin-binding subunit
MTIRIVTTPLCSPGSNQVGAIVTCTAHVIGACAVAGAGAKPWNRARPKTRARSRRRTFMSDLLSALSRRRT